MYVHVPSAWLATFLYFSLAISCVFYLVWKHPLADLVSSSIAPIGALFSALTLVTGSLWGKPMWHMVGMGCKINVNAGIILFYLGYILLSNAFERKIDGSKTASVLAIVGLINLPIVKFSVIGGILFINQQVLLKLEAHLLMINVVTLNINVFCIKFFFFIFDNLKCKNQID